MGKVIRKVFKNEEFSLHECTDGYFLYDYVLGQNISMRAKTEQDALIEALVFYQKRLISSKSAYNILNNKVESFLSQFDREEY